MRWYFPYLNHILNGTLDSSSGNRPQMPSFRFLRNKVRKAKSLLCLLTEKFWREMKWSGGVFLISWKKKMFIWSWFHECFLKLVDPVNSVWSAKLGSDLHTLTWTILLFWLSTPLSRRDHQLTENDLDSRETKSKGESRINVYKFSSRFPPSPSNLFQDSSILEC